ncbi:hypothetical protein FWD20_02695 [Candidatus Saccharibacteria bacterium]|nr:hypothetical protein [Candidatus Saccharibacteria bacterium]
MKKFSLIVCIAVLAAVSLATPRVLAMPSINTIVANCGIAQSVLNQIEKADTESRVKRGYDYDELLNLMFAMNARLSANKIAAPTLTDLTSQFEQSLATFRANHYKYSDALLKAVNTRCTNRPLDFYDALENARTIRALLRQDVITLEQNINDFFNEFNVIIEEEL